MDRRNRIGKITKERYKNTIRDVVDNLSRKVLIYKQPQKNKCPNCYFDKLTELSSGKCRWTPVEIQNFNDPTRYKYFLRGRCPICNGQGYLVTIRKTWVNCLVTWNPRFSGENSLLFTSAGSTGATVVQLKTHPKNYNLFKNAQKIVVDDIECSITLPPLKRGLGNEALLIIFGFTEEKKQPIDKGEIIKDYRT